ncbi:hypothetical protein Mmc1_0935 [Magnetococcus marinus MC-1]|uniref:Uncharacterized protein n=1 Tax=Magnetococcus marinus (strain ATCC BAA-1437 / JCM 17883 / MC-1) TaxID=156889 RepID=A0L660_MAGMM|nr:hypothetical protein [Magnetococcus marinus]ABK43453.1 hypothetical protein Mmc1_0935 [Magnetococcus marinus MC-1]
MSINTILELDGQRVQLSVKRAKDVADVNEVSGDRWLITDFGGSVPRLMMVDAQLKYAEIKLQRKLQEMGEGDENSRILTLWKKKRGENSTEVLFGVVPGANMGVYEDLAFESRDLHLTFSFNRLLLATLEKYGLKQNVVVLFEHDRHVDYMVGKQGRILGAGRMSSFAATSEAKLALAETIAEEMKLLEKENHQKIDRIIHFGYYRSEAVEGGESQSTVQTSSTAFGQTKVGDAKTGWVGEDGQATGGADASWVIALAELLECTPEVLSPSRLSMGDGSFLITSIPKVLPLLKAWDAVNKDLDKAAYSGQRLAPWLTAAVWVLVIGGLFVHFWFERNAALIQADARQLKSKIEQQGQVETVVELSDAEKDMVRFAGQLANLTKIYDAKRIIADLSQARSDRKIQLLHLLITHENQLPTILVEGRIDNPFSVASKEHEKFLSALRSKGYTLLENQLDTDILQLNFKLKLTRERES